MIQKTQRRGKDWQIIGSRKAKCSQWYKRHREGEKTDKLCLLYHCEHLTFLLPMICQSFPLSVSFVSLWALGFPTTYDLSVFSPSLCLLYHCEHLAFLLPMICQSFPLLCVFCIIVSTLLSYYLGFVSLFPFCVFCIIVSTWLSYYLWFVSLFPFCVFCIIVSTWLSYYLWFVNLFPSSVSFVSLWALSFPTTYDLSVFSPLCVFCIIVSTWLSYYLWFVSIFLSSVSFVSLWALDFPTTYDLSVFSPLCVFCIIVSKQQSQVLTMIQKTQRRGKDWQIIGSRKAKCSQWYKRHRGAERTDKS